MRLGNIVLGFAASCSIVAGALVQGTAQKTQSLPISLFAQAKKEDFTGDKKCGECHEETTANFHKSPHATYMQNSKLPLDKQGCEACHGPGELHTRDENPLVLAYGKLTPREVDQACLRCHGDTMKASKWHAGAHSRGNVSCVSCHQIHPKSDTTAAEMGDRNLVKKQVFASAKPPEHLLKSDQATVCGECHRTEIAQFRQISHHPVPEGRMVCSDCHSVHPNSADHKKISVIKEKCVSCHGDIAGPFVFEHDPVAGWTGAGCGECHRAHGSQNPRLLRGFSRGLCAQCHTDKGANHFPGRTCWSAGCHVALHGSNTDRHLLQR